MKRQEKESLIQHLTAFGRKIRSLTFCVAPMFILMSQCIRTEPPEDPFAQTNEGKGVMAFRIGEEEHVAWDRNIMFGPPTFNTYLSLNLMGPDGVYKFYTSGGDMSLSIDSAEPLEIGVKYSISDITDDLPAVNIVYTSSFINKTATLYKATSGHITFRHISDNIVSGNFEAQMVKTSNLDATDEPDQITVTDGTFDLRH